jgi:hypothetical protein
MATITSGGVAQTAIAADVNRMGYRIQNQSTGDLYIRDDGTAATVADVCLKILPGAYYETPPTSHPKGAVSIIGATTGQAFFPEKW